MPDRSKRLPTGPPVAWTLSVCSGIDGTLSARDGVAGTLLVRDGVTGTISARGGVTGAISAGAGAALCICEDTAGGVIRPCKEARRCIADRFRIVFGLWVAASPSAPNEARINSCKRARRGSTDGMEAPAPSPAAAAGGAAATAIRALIGPIACWSAGSIEPIKSLINLAPSGC